MNERDTALAAVARDAARAGDYNMAGRSAEEILSGVPEDEARLEAGREFLKAGHRQSHVDRPMYAFRHEARCGVARDRRKRSNDSKHKKAWRYHRSHP
jgi:hypothetical protein